MVKRGELNTISYIDMDTKEFQPKRLEPKRLGKAAAAVAGLTLGISAIASGCGGGSGEGNTTPTSTDTGIRTDVPTMTVTPTLNPGDGIKGGGETPILAPTPEPTPVPTETPTPTEAPIVNCEILPPNICSSAEVIDWTGSEGNKFIVLGFKNVPPGTRIASLTNAVVHPGRYGEGSEFKGMAALVDDISGTKTTMLIGDIGFENPESSYNVNIGDTITTIQGTGIDNFGYNLLITFIKISENGAQIDDFETLEKYFPGITSKTPNGTVEIDSSGTVLSNFEYID